MPARFRLLAIAFVLVAWGCAPTSGAASASTVVSPPATTAAAPAAPAAPTLPAGLRLGWPIWIGVVCDDLQAQRRFYRDVLGLEERNVSQSSVWFVFDGKLLELLQKTERAQYAERRVMVGFAVDDLRAARALLIERGVVPVGDIESDGEDRWAYFKDVEGNLFELAQAPARR